MVEALAVEKRPGGQASQPPAGREYMPAGHSWHVSDPACDQRPAVQLVQALEALPENVLAGHGEHTESPDRAHRPAVQLLQAPVTASVAEPSRQP